MLSNYQLQKYAEKFLRETYGLSLSVPLELNGRLKKACGRFVYYRRSRTPKIIELNKTFVETNEPTVVLDVLRHELVHYALFMLGKPHHDGHPVFEKELKRLGIVSQNNVNKYSMMVKKQIYQCNTCENEFKMTRRLKNNGIHHRCSCGGRLVDKGKRIVTV